MSHPEYHNRNFRMNQRGPDRYTFLPPARRFSVQGLARLARPEEIASAALFLASDQSSYVAGIDLPVDGGLTAVRPKDLGALQLAKFRHTGLTVSRLCLGTATFGKQTDEAESHRILDAAARLGDQLSRYRQFLSHGRRGRAARLHGRDHRTLAQRQTPPLYRRVKAGAPMAR